MGKYLKDIRKFRLIMLEHAVQANVLKKYDNFLIDIKSVKLNLKQLQILIKDLKKEIKNLKYYDIELIEKFGNIDMYVCYYSGIANPIILKIISFLDNNNKFNEIVFPEGDVIKHNLFPKIEIEINNFNRIHIGELPTILRGIGVGTKVYKSMIKKIGYISSIGLDRSQDAELIWYSISKDKNIYSFVSDKKIIAISSNTEFEKIMTIIKDYFKYELENNYSIVLDSDFNKNFGIKTELLNKL